MSEPASQPERVDERERNSIVRSGWWRGLVNDEDVRRWLKAVILLGFTLFFVLFFGFMAFNILIEPDSWVLQQIEANFAGTIGVAFAAVASLFVVLLLQYSVGHIRLRGLGFEFEGASAPTVLWLFCFLAIISGIKLLWGT